MVFFTALHLLMMFQLGVKWVGFIEGKGQFFPLSGEFNDGSIKVVDSTTDVLDVDVKVEKKKRAKKSSE
jgi:hypothetical protein